MKRGMRRAGVAGLLLAGTVTGAAPAALASGHPAPVSQWRVVARTPGFLDAVIAPASTSAWAFGWIGGNGLIAPVVRHWNGRVWASVTLPRAVSDTGMACAGASSPGNVWSFFGTGASLGNGPGIAGALVLRHGRWLLAKTFPATGTEVTGCNVLGPADVWVFGGGVAGLAPPAGTWHLTRSGWTELNTGNLVLVKASAAAANDIWATGAISIDQGARSTPLVAHWNGRAWVENRSIAAVLPRPTSRTFVGVDAIKAFSASNVWVEGVIEGQSGGIISVVVVHWDGRRWHRVSPASPGYHLPDAVPDGRGGWWAPPFIQSPSAPYLLHEANGRWTRFPLPVSGLTLRGVSLARVPGTASMLAVCSTTRGGVVLARGRLPG